MLENLKLAVKRQKKLILIFCLTIFIPSIALSIFGIRAIRNERFHLAKQIENEHRRAAEDLKSQISSYLEELGSNLQSLAQSNSLQQKNGVDFKNLLDEEIAGNSLVEQVFVVFEGEEPVFPLFQPVPYVISSASDSKLGTSFQERLRRAETYEFKEKNYKSAISLYRGLFEISKDINLKARMLANMARCMIKTEDYESAIRNYQRVIDDYPKSFSSEGLPLALISQLQMASCCRNLGESQTSLQTFLDLYKDILRMRWPLRESQFKTYAALVENSISEGLSENQPGLPLEDYKKEYDRLKGLHQERLEQWMVIDDIRREIVPEL